MRYPATAAIVTACLGVHAYLGTLTDTARVAFEDTWGMTPAFLSTSFTTREAVTLVTSLFVHAGLGALVAGMAVMVALGPRVERRMGSVGFLFYYLLSGALGGLYTSFSDPGVIVPQLGAGAAVAGVALAWLVSRISAGQSTTTPVRHTPSARYAEMAS
jgi:membrane associated rhomboid family serine protease